MVVIDKFNLDDLLSSEPSHAVSVAPPPAESAVAAGGGVAYDGSSIHDQLATWSPALRSADSDLLFEKPRLDGRARDMLRNDGYIAGGAAVHKDSIVGEEYRLNAKPSSKLLYGTDDEAWDDEASEEIEMKFRMYAESPLCWPDAQRVNTLTGLVRMAVGVHVAGGEVLGAAMWKDDGRPFASNLLMIDADRLSNPRNGSTYDWRLRAGVERDKHGAPIAYHIRNAHPSDPRAAGLADPNTWTRVRRFNSWGRPQILHIYETMRPDQSRGVASMAAALQEMRMLKHFRKTELQRAIIAATYAANIETEFPAEAAMAMGAGQGSENGYINALMELMAAQAEFQSNAKNVHMEGAKIPVFMPNTKLRIQNPGAQSPAGADFEASMLRYISAALGVSYEELSRDYTKTNYSSARASIGKSLQGMRPRKRLVADTTANFVYRLWMEEVLNYNDLECFKRRRTPSFYERQNAEFFCNAEWTGAGVPMIDPMKETQADLLAIKGGLMTQETAVAKRGGDFRTVKRQIRRERMMDEALGNPSIYDSIATKDMDNALSGSPREPKEGQADGE